MCIRDSLHVELTWSLLGKRSHNIDEAIFGQIDFKQLGGGDGTKPVWHAGGRPWILRFNTIRKGAASQGICQAFRIGKAHRGWWTTTMRAWHIPV